MQNQLAFIDEDLRLLLKELLTVCLKVIITLLHLFRHGGTEHHHLLVMRSLHEDVLDVCSHARVAQHLVALIHHEELALNITCLTFSKSINLCLARSYSLPGVEIIM